MILAHVATVVNLKSAVVSRCRDSFKTGFYGAGKSISFSPVVSQGEMPSAQKDVNELS